MPGQFTPTQVFTEGGATVALASWPSAASTLSDIAAAPVFTSSTPSPPTDAVRLTPSATSMKTLPCTGSTCTWPSLGLWSAMLFSTATADLDDGTRSVFANAGSASAPLYSG